MSQQRENTKIDYGEEEKMIGTGDLFSLQFFLF